MINAFLLILSANKTPIFNRTRLIIKCLLSANLVRAFWWSWMNSERWQFMTQSSFADDECALPYSIPTENMSATPSCCQRHCSNRWQPLWNRFVSSCAWLKFCVKNIHHHGFLSVSFFVVVKLLSTFYPVIYLYFIRELCQCGEVEIKLLVTFYEMPQAWTSNFITKRVCDCCHGGEKEASMCLCLVRDGCFCYSCSSHT